MINIDKGIDFPIKTTTKERLYPFKQMNIGDSFLFRKDVTTKNKKTASTRCSVENKKTVTVLFKWAVTDDGIRIFCLDKN
jgi:hypothetical protein